MDYFHIFCEMFLNITLLSERKGISCENWSWINIFPLIESDRFLLELPPWARIWLCSKGIGIISSNTTFFHHKNDSSLSRCGKWTTIFPIIKIRRFRLAFSRLISHVDLNFNPSENATHKPSGTATTTADKLFLFPLASSVVMLGRERDILWELRPTSTLYDNGGWMMKKDRPETGFYEAAKFNCPNWMNYYCISLNFRSLFTLTFARLSPYLMIEREECIKMFQ